MRLFIGALFLITIFVIPAYGNTTSNVVIENTNGNATIHNSTDTVVIKNSTLFDKLLNIELNVNSCQKNVTENCQIVSSKLDNLTATSVKIKNEVNLDDAYTKIGLGLAAVSLWFVFWVFFVQDKQSKKLKKLVDDVHDFSEEQKTIKNAKRKRYSLTILFGLRLIEFEIEGMVTHQKFRDTEDADERSKYDKQLQIGYYEKAQKRFLDIDVEYDAILEIFNEKIEDQYRQAWNALRTPTIYVEFDNSDKVWEKINKIGQAFEDLKKSIIEYADDPTKAEYYDLFDSRKYRKEDSNRPATVGRP